MSTLCYQSLHVDSSTVAHSKATKQLDLTPPPTSDYRPTSCRASACHTVGGREVSPREAALQWSCQAGGCGQAAVEHFSFDETRRRCLLVFMHHSCHSKRSTIQLRGRIFFCPRCCRREMSPSTWLGQCSTGAVSSSATSSSWTSAVRLLAQSPA